MLNQDNSSLEQQVKTYLNADPFLRSADITVSADEGKITLEGVVDSEDERRKAGESVRSVAGVKSIDNQLRLRGQGSQSVGEYFDDAKITLAVKSKLMGESGLSSMHIHVETKDGIVELSGDVKNHEQISTAETIARQTDGVKKVVNRLIMAS